MSRLAFAMTGALAALVPAVVMIGFTVDDALISIRYAHHIAMGEGYRFGAAPTDGVTPLWWPWVLAPFARGSSLSTLAFARWLGIGLWTITGACLGVRTVDIGGRRRAAWVLALLALVFPIGAWAASGMETALATALATGGVLCMHRPRVAALLVGLAASLRPEMAPWAVAIAVGAAAPRPSAMILGVGIGIAPLVTCTAIRLVAFGHAAPLAVLAKPGDPSQGFTYAIAAAVVMLLPLVLPFGRGARVLVVAFVVHLVAVTLVGGDWMAYARLVVPVAPSLVLAVATPGHRVATPVRAVLAAALGVFVAVRAAPAGRGVARDREALIEAARPVLARSRVVAALDIGWTSAAFDGEIVDLAGLTDRSIAVLPGGHTSKHVDASMLLDRGVDTVVVFGEPRGVEQRLLRAPLFRERFEQAETVGGGHLVYRLYRAISTNPEK